MRELLERLERNEAIKQFETNRTSYFSDSVVSSLDCSTRSHSINHIHVHLGALFPCL